MTTAHSSGFGVREFQPGDGAGLRALWVAAGFRLHGDDDRGLETFADRNPGLFLVATTPGGAIVGSAMGAWDGRRGWIYHVATAATYRRTGVASELVGRIEARLVELGVVRVNVLVREGNDRGRAFWTAAGYEAASRQFGKDLGRDGPGESSTAGAGAGSSAGGRSASGDPAS
jgi:ribosomal protein S18 acetylase RimI-like enzyme